MFGDFLTITLVMAALAVVVLGVTAVAVQRHFRKKQRVAPGTESAAPLEWVGAHTPEAKLHRRLVAALNGLRNAAGTNALVADNIAVLESEGVRVERQLVAASHLADRLEGPALEQLDAAVTQIEDVSAQLIHWSAELSRSDVQNQVDELAERLDLLDQARAELDDPRPGTG